MITLENIENCGEYIVVEAPSPLRTFSSATHNPGYGEYIHFVNRTVDKSYFPDDVQQEIEGFLRNEGFKLEETVAMMTAVEMKCAETSFYVDGDTSITLLVTAGLGNTVDVTNSYQYAYRREMGTINIFIFINGQCSDEALIQALCCAVEVKTKILHEKKVLDHQTGTIATGTSTDSILVAATQKGEMHEYDGSITRLGSLIGKGLYETLNKAIEQYLAFKEA